MVNGTNASYVSHQIERICVFFTVRVSLLIGKRQQVSNPLPTRNLLSIEKNCNRIKRLGRGQGATSALALKNSRPFKPLFFFKVKVL